MESIDPYGRAIRDHYLGNQDAPLLDRDGVATRNHPIEEFYFEEITNESDRQQWRDAWLDGPLLDMGAGVGSQALYWQDQFETVAIEASDHLVKTMGDRGVENAINADMFALRDHFERDRFQSVHAKGTQAQLAGSMDGLRKFLSDLDAVTTPDATAILSTSQSVLSSPLLKRELPTNLGWTCAPTIDTDVRRRESVAVGGDQPPTRQCCH